MAILETTRKHGLKIQWQELITFGLGIHVLCQLKATGMCPQGRKNIFRLSVVINLNYYECPVWNYSWLKLPENSTFEKNQCKFNV